MDFVTKNNFQIDIKRWSLAQIFFQENVLDILKLKNGGEIQDYVDNYRN